jgi:hypothetical protein
LYCSADTEFPDSRIANSNTALACIDLWRSDLMRLWIVFERHLGSE